MKYLKKTFSVFMTGSFYDKNYDRIFHKSWREKIKLWFDKLLTKLFLE